MPCWHRCLMVCSTFVVENKPGHWMTPYGEVNSRELPHKLLQLASEHAHRAISASDGTPLNAFDRATSLGAAAELLIKSTLAGISVTLLAGNISVPTLAQFGAVPVDITNSKSKKAVTVGASESLARLNSLLPSDGQVSSVSRIFEVRNEAIHLGVLPTEQEASAARAELVNLVDEVFAARTYLKQRHGELKEFWSDKYLPVVESVRNKTFEDLRAKFAARVSQASARYDTLVSPLEPGRRSEMISQITAQATARAAALDYLIRPHECPGCKNWTLQAFYELDRQVEIDDSSAPHSFAFVARETTALDFAECPICGLHVGRDSVGFTGIPLSVGVREGDATDDEASAWLDWQRDKLWQAAEYADIEPSASEYD